MTPTNSDEQRPPLWISGNVHTRREAEVLGLADEDPESLLDLIRDDVDNGDHLAVGDLKVYPRLDQQGSMAARGGNANYGYSGFFSASIFDGEKWRRFDLRTVVPEKESGFAAQREKPDVLERIRECVKAALGRQCVWTVPDGKVQGRYMAAPPPNGSMP